MSDETAPKPVKRARARRAEVLTRPLAKQVERMIVPSVPELQIEVLDTPHTKLIRVEPPRYCQRILVVDKTTTPGRLLVHASTGIDGTIFVQVVEAPAAAAPAPAPEPWCEECATNGMPHRYWCGVR